ncbi:MAG: diguanylate cyclase, partial [Candidatus Latescibacteria bacterium]|nr:diguanylate cyclase [Candidatus Latescibacterota bacterium]
RSGESTGERTTVGGTEPIYVRLWERALCCSVAGQVIAERAGLGIGDEALVAGLLEDIGMFLMAYSLRDDYIRVLEEAERRGVEMTTAEEELLGVNHTQVGMILAERWMLPDALAVSIQYHHNPAVVRKQGMSEDIAKVVEVAYLSGLAADIFYGWGKSQRISQFKDGLLTLVHLDDSIAEDILSRLIDLTREMASCFQIQVDTDASRSYAKILQEANVELGRMNMKYDQMYRELMAGVGQLHQKNEELARLTTELEEKNRLLQNLADRDGLTGVFNYRYFEEFLTRQVAQTRRYNRALSLIMIDIDNFKDLNDTYGHQQGNVVLRELAQIFTSSVRQADLVARYGGEEFVIVLVETELKGAVHAAEKVRHLVERFLFPREEGNPLHVTISLGVATLSPDLQTAHQLIEAADKALYEAKQRGRNTVYVERL